MSWAGSCVSLQIPFSPYRLSQTQVARSSTFCPGSTQSFPVGSTSRLDHLLSIFLCQLQKRKRTVQHLSTPNQENDKAFLFSSSLCFYSIHIMHLCPTTNRLNLRVRVGRDIFVVIKRTGNSLVDNIH